MGLCRAALHARVFTMAHIFFLSLWQLRELHSILVSSDEATDAIPQDGLGSILLS